MNKVLVSALVTLSFAAAAQAALKPGDSLSAYEIKNVATGKQYCQVCQYGVKSAKLVAFGKLSDKAFWADLKALQKLQDQYKSMGVFAQIIDSKDTAAIKAAAANHGITFPVVVAVEKDWDKAYDVKGISRTIYYANDGNRIAWTSVGLSDKALSKLSAQVKRDLKS